MTAKAARHCKSITDSAEMVASSHFKQITILGELTQ